MDMRVVQRVVPDDGSDGFFWRNGDKWLRERGRESRLLDLAPNLEPWAMLSLSTIEQRACEASR